MFGSESGLGRFRMSFCLTSSQNIVTINERLYRHSLPENQVNCPWQVPLGEQIQRPSRHATRQGSASSRLSGRRVESLTSGRLMVTTVRRQLLVTISSAPADSTCAIFFHIRLQAKVRSKDAE
jgi:hypothetical protein